jgi:hypothetical protein
MLCSTKKRARLGGWGPACESENHFQLQLHCPARTVWGSTTDITLRRDPGHITPSRVSASLFRCNIRVLRGPDFTFCLSLPESFRLDACAIPARQLQSYGFHTPGLQIVKVLYLPVLC